MNAWKSPIRILVIYLTVLALWASYNWGGLELQFWLQQCLHFALLILPGWLMYQVLLRFKVIRSTRWEHRLITSLILFLLFDPIFPTWVFLALGMITEPVQRFLRVPTGPLANPAALSALALSLVGQFPTWWGTNFGTRIDIIPGGMSLVMLLTVPLAGYVAHKYKKLDIIAPAVIMFSLGYLLFIRSNPLALVLEGTFAFFLLIMAVEPKTSPAIQKQQWVYGGAVGLLVALFLYAGLQSIWIEPYVAALVLCNIVFNLYRNRKLLQARFSRPKPAVATPVMGANPPSSAVS